jgi:hypothetical protein
MQCTYSATLLALKDLILSNEIVIRPPVGSELMGQGRVVAHERVIDSLGRFHGLLRLVVEHSEEFPDIVVWSGVLLAGHQVKGVSGNQLAPKCYRLTILYKLESLGDYDATINDKSDDVCTLDQGRA